MRAQGPAIHRWQNFSENITAKTHLYSPGYYDFNAVVEVTLAMSDNGTRIKYLNFLLSMIKYVKKYYKWSFFI